MAFRWAVEVLCGCGGQGNVEGLKQIKKKNPQKDSTTMRKRDYCIVSCMSEGMLVCVMLPCPISTSEGNCKLHFISLLLFRNVVGFGWLNRLCLGTHLYLYCKDSTAEGEPNSRAKVPDLDQWQHLGNISPGPRRTCSTREIGYIGFAWWELPLLPSQYNPLSSRVCGYCLSA